MSLSDDIVSIMMPISMTLPLLHEVTITQIVNMAGIGSKRAVITLDMAIFPSSAKKTNHTQFDSWMDKPILMEQTATMTETGRLICRAWLVPCGNSRLDSMIGAASANATLGSVYQPSSNVPANTG